MITSFLLTIPEDSDRNYMEWLFNEHYNLMMATARNFTQQIHDANEIVSESLIALYGKIDKLRQLERNDLRLYIVSTVKNTSLNYLRQNRRMNVWFLHVPDVVMNQMPDGKSTEQKILLSDELSHVLKAIYALPDRERLAMRLKFEMDMSDKEISEAMEISPDSVRRYINRAREHLRQMVFEEEDD